MSQLYLTGNDNSGSWSSTAGTLNGTILHAFGVAEGTNITLTYTVANAECGNVSESVTFTVEDCTCNALAAFAPPPAFCAGSTFDLSALTTDNSNGYWLINNNQISINSGILDPNNISGNFVLSYVVEDENPDCPADTATQTLTITPLPTVTATASNNIVNAGETIILSAAGATDYEWFDTNGNSLGTGTNISVTMEATTTFLVQGSDGDNCTDDATVTVIVNDNQHLFFPSGFSPNGDNINDVFHPIHQNVVEIHWMVYNRWGNKVFETNSLDDYWDGTFRGEPQEMEVYVYVAEYKYFGEEDKKVMRGNVTLVR